MSLFSKKHLSADEQKTGESVSAGHVGNVSTNLDPLLLIQQSLSDIHVRLNKLDAVDQCVKDIKQDLWGTEGLDEKITYVAQQSEECSSDIQGLKAENAHLRKEMELLKSVVIKMDRKINEQNKEIINLKGRSMRDNLLIHNFEESAGENLDEAVNAAIKQHLDIDVKFIRIHRNSPTPNIYGKPRTITAKLADFSKKAEILTAQKAKKNESVRLPFNITPQSPTEVVEKRKQLFELNDKYRKENIKTRVVGERLLFPDNSAYREKVEAPKAEDILRMDQKETEKLEKISIVKSNAVIESGNKFIASGTKVQSLNELRRFYKKVASIPENVQAHHNVLIYRYIDSEGKMQEGYVDDGEFGAGRKMLKYITENGITNAAFVVTRWYSGKHIGPKRFLIMEQCIGQIVGDM